MTESTAHVSEPREEVKLKTLGFLLLLNERKNWVNETVIKHTVQHDILYISLRNYVPQRDSVVADRT